MSDDKEQSDNYSYSSTNTSGEGFQGQIEVYADLPTLQLKKSPESWG